MLVSNRDHTFPVENTSRGRCMVVQTRIVPKWEGMRLYFDFVVHRTGVFPNKDHLEYETPNGETAAGYLRQRQEVHDAIDFRTLRVGVA
jgi:hypothetical protein